MSIIGRTISVRLEKAGKDGKTESYDDHGVVIDKVNLSNINEDGIAITLDNYMVQLDGKGLTFVHPFRIVKVHNVTKGEEKEK